jgi:EB module
VEKTTCQHSQCRCFFGYHSNSEKKKCLKDVNLNEACYSNDECVAEYSQCQGTCKCKPSHVQSKLDGITCLPLATSLYQTCQQNSQCSSIPNSHCGSNSTCICMNEYHDINKVRIVKNSSAINDQSITVQIQFNFFQRCWPTVRLNEICESDENCIVENSSCKNNRCTCDDEYYELGRICSKADKVQKNFLIVLIFYYLLRLF